MRNAATFALLLPLGGVPFAGCATPQAHFGEPMRLADQDAVSLTKVLAGPDDYDGKYIRLNGKVSDVCEKRGCWLELSHADADETTLVKFTCPVEGRLIPMEAIGCEAVVEGTTEWVYLLL